MTKQPVYEYRQRVADFGRAKIASVLSVGAMSVALGAGCFLVVNPSASKDLAKVLIPIGLASGVSSLLTAAVASEAGHAMADYRDISEQQRNNNAYQQMMPVVRIQAAEDDDELKPFNWTTFKYKYDQYPHIGILASSGSGKSMLAEYICSVLGGITIAIDPHYESGHYPSAHLVISNRDGKTDGINLKEEPKGFLDILEGNALPTIPDFIHSLWSEMQWRLSLGHDGKFIGSTEPEVNIIFDEFNSYSSTKNVGKLVSEMLRESRKARLRCVFICQNADLAAMGLEQGTGSVRSNIAFIRLGDEAVRYAETKMIAGADQEKWVQVLKKFKKDLVPCLVEDEYAVVPYVIR